MQINERIIKIGGKATLLEPLEVGTAFKLEVDGAVTATTYSDNHDGTFDETFKFEPITISVLKNNGQITKTKDTRARSVQMRAVITREWREDTASELTAEEYYDRRMVEILDMIINKRI